jgi:hypothetical protein
MEDPVTEDDAPVDSILSKKQHHLLTTPLYGAWAGPEKMTPGQCRFMALANVGLFGSVNFPVMRTLEKICVRGLTRLSSW